MRAIALKTLREFWEEYPDAEEPLRAWYRITEKAIWGNITETRLDFPHADAVGTCTVFNIGGNKYRLITGVRYQKQRVYILHILTHSEYDRENWKDDCYC